MRLEKWHGAGNAYLVVEEADLPFPLTAPRIERICDADTGPGSDGILAIGDGSHVRIFNPDGGEAEFSGNGTRIAAGYLMRRDGTDEVVMQTVKGTVRGARDGGQITIDAGRASLESERDHRPDGSDPPAAAYTFVSVGNPHCVIEVEDPDVLDLASIGPQLERHPWFPNRANVEFYRALAPDRIRMRVWERGAGETRSSGSGSTAAAVASVVAGRTSSPVTVQTDGGDLVIEIADDLGIRLTGPVERIAAVDLDGDYVAMLEELG